jgi:hypothetical protein
MQISGSTLESMAEQWAETAGRRPTGQIGKGVGLGWLGWLGYIEVNHYLRKPLIWWEHDLTPDRCDGCQIQSDSTHP